MESLGRWVLGAVVITGAITDWRMGKIPNWLTLPAMAAGLVINTVVGSGLRVAGLGLAAALGLFLLFFAVGFMGAGDGKLMGAVGAFVGWPQIATVMVMIAVLGGVAGLLVAMRHGALSQVVRNIGGLVSSFARLRWSELREQSDYRAPGRLRLPYGVVIAAGTLVFLVFSPR